MYTCEGPTGWRDLMRALARGERCEVPETVAQYLAGTSRRGNYLPDLDGVPARAWTEEGKHYLQRYRPRARQKTR